MNNDGFSLLGFRILGGDAWRCLRIDRSGEGMGDGVSDSVFVRRKFLGTKIWEVNYDTDCNSLYRNVTSQIWPFTTVGSQVHQASSIVSQKLSRLQNQKIEKVAAMGKKTNRENSGQ